MKQNIKSIGEVELSQEEYKEALLLAAKDDKKFSFNAVENYLRVVHGFKMKKLASTVVGGQIVIKAEVESEKSETDRTLFSVEQAKKTGSGGGAGGHKKPNMGFHTELAAYLYDETKKSKHKEPVPFDKALADMQFKYPQLHKRLFTIYCSDKRQQKKKGYYFDGQNKLLYSRNYVAAK